MRFAYIDSQGNEVAIPSVDALRLRIALRAIVEDTVFYDASSERWAPAREHEIFRTLQKELGEQEGETFVAPSPSSPSPEPEGDASDPGAGATDVVVGLDDELELEVEGLDETVDEPGPGPVEGASQDDEDQEENWRFAISNAPSDSGARGGASEGPTGPTPLDPDDADDLLEGVLELEEDADDSLDEGTGPEEVLASDDGIEPEAAGEPTAAEGQDARLGTSSWLELDGKEENPDFDLDDPRFSESEAEDVSHGDLQLSPEFLEPTHLAEGKGSDGDDNLEPLAGLSQDRFEVDGTLQDAGWGDEPPPSESNDDDIVLDADAGTVEEPPSEPPSGVPPARPTPVAREDLPVPNREELAARRAEADAARSRPRPGPPPRRRDRSRGGVGVLVAVGLVVLASGGAWWYLGGDGGAADETPPRSVTMPDLPVALEPQMRALAAEVREESLDELRRIRALATVPAEPDREWLAGVYLANASRYPDVQVYWEAMDRFLRTMQAAEDSLFTAVLSRTIASATLAADTADMLEARILAGFRATAQDRGVIYQRARAVAEASLRLHGFLLDNEGAITHEPGMGGLAGDPVLEAIPSTPRLGDEMWERVGEITSAMDTLGFLDRITTERLVDAIIQRLSDIPLR